MELFNQDDIKNLIMEIYYYMGDNGKLPDFLSFESFLKAEKEIEESKRAINDLCLLYSQKLELTEKNKDNFKCQERYNYMISEYKYLINNFEKLKSSMIEIRDFLGDSVLDASEESFKYGFLAHKELNKSLNI